jgi:type I restriction enzyme R subunit
VRIVTELAADGMTWRAGEEMITIAAATNLPSTITLPDEVSLDIDSYNRRVVTESFNRVVCERLAAHIDPRASEKTIVFCANDDHADLVVMLLKKAFDAAYGAIDDDLVVKITGVVDKPQQMIRRFKNEHAPTVAVSVDLLTTGIDVPKVANIVFLRRVKSRILYEQMLGRATRLCPEIDKQAFRVFDAVDLYANLAPLSDMRPVAMNPQITFEQLAKEIAEQTARHARGDPRSALGQAPSQAARDERRGQRAFPRAHRPRGSPTTRRSRRSSIRRRAARTRT